MQVIVLGAGAIGSLYGAKLALVGNDVTLIGRSDHVAAIRANGLRMEGLEPRVVRLSADTRVQEIGSDAIILLTTKVPATATAAALVAPLVRDDTTILCLQNGLGSEALARTALNYRGTVLRGITQFGAIFDEPGVVRYTVRGHTLIENHDRAPAVAALLNAAGLDARISLNIRADVWRKLIYNCVVNPITTVIGAEVGSIADARLNSLKRLVIEEALAVAATEGVTFRNDLLREIDDVFRGSPNIVSMRQDLLSGRATEIEYMNGAVASLGRERGVNCPVNSALTEIIRAMEQQARHSSHRKCSSRSRLSRDLASSLRAPPANASFS